MKEVTVNPFKGSMDLCEAVSGAMKLCLLDEGNTRLHTPIQCKDYLQDAFWSETKKKNVEVYGFVWKPGTLPLDQRRYSLEVSAGSKSSLEGLENSLALLHEWERRLKFARTLLWTVGNHPGYVFRLSQAWFKQPIRISTVSLMIRVGTKYTEGRDPIEYLSMLEKTPYPQDKSVVNTAMKRLTTIWEEKKFPAQTFEQFKEEYEMHNGSGLRDYKRSEL